ncbi:Cold shock protein 2 (fragment) [Nitrospira japonica]|uniref:Cold shock protein 2 n=1 Tax=Nitrospira japonica TaxID=1325564 RepID=A0A1W1I2P6_9BACT
MYFHRNALQGLSFQDLDDGSEVLFNVEKGRKGPQATAVHPMPAMPR